MVKDIPQLIIDIVSENTINEKVLLLLKDKSLTNRVFMSKLILTLK